MATTKTFVKFNPKDLEEHKNTLLKHSKNLVSIEYQMGVMNDIIVKQQPKGRNT